MYKKSFKITEAINSDRQAEFRLHWRRTGGCRIPFGEWGTNLTWLKTRTRSKRFFFLFLSFRICFSTLEILPPAFLVLKNTGSTSNLSVLRTVAEGRDGGIVKARGRGGGSFFKTRQRTNDKTPVYRSFIGGDTWRVLHGPLWNVCFPAPERRLRHLHE